MLSILERLESHNEYAESSEARQLRKDAAEEIRRLTLENARLLKTAETHHRKRLDAEAQLKMAKAA